MKAYQQKQLLERIGRDGATVGRQLPEGIEIQGETIDLREFVFEIKRRETVPPGERERVEQAKKNLRRERLELLEQIEAGEITREEGEDLAQSIIGIDRALNALESLGPTDLEREQKLQHAQDRKRWMSFLKKALGEKDDASARRGR